jgi:hypothetical protein
LQESVQAQQFDNDNDGPAYIGQVMSELGKY